MPSALFWICAVLMLIFGCSVVFQKNAISSAISLVVTFVALAILYLSLDAFFIATIQVLIYAGAVMVLFLFIIMLLDLKVEVKRKVNPIAITGGICLGLIFIAQLFGVLSTLPFGKLPMPPLATALWGNYSDVRNIGMVIFTDYNLPLQIVGVLLLVATIGVVILSKRELK